MPSCRTFALDFLVKIGLDGNRFRLLIGIGFLVVAAGVVSPLGFGLPETLASLRAAKDCITPVARFSVAQCRCKLRCRDIEVFTGDAATFEVPTDATTIYFYNPFAGKILASVLDNIYFSYEKRPRTIKLICNVPRESAFFANVTYL